MAETNHRNTGILLLIFALLVLLGAIFFTVSQSKVMTIDEYKTGNSKLNSAKNNLLTAYILGYIAAGMGIILAIIYFGHVAWGINNEIPHLIIFILLFGLVVVSGIFGFLALSNIDSSGAKDKKSSTNWIWAAQVAGLIGLIVLIISGAWRAQHLASKAKGSSPYRGDQQEATFTAPSQVNYQGAPQMMSAPQMSAPAYPAPTKVYSTTQYADYQ